ncbi:MAG: argininosuccinate lyase, partial [Pirellulales bacterium]|nr:argininosuccinate lyase [Pirellulales bacterium]
QKKNPDVLELIRGRASRIVGHLTGLFTLIKGLPLAYNRDLQEDKLPLFNSFDTVFSCVEIAIPLIEETHWNRGDIGAKLEEGYLDATTLMEYLILEGVPQRTAHHAVGTLVRKAIEMKITLRELPLDAIQSVCESVDDRVYQVLGAKNALQTFRSSGSTNPDEVKHHIARWQKRLQHN